MDGTAQKRFGISAAVLKWIAVVTMVTDHFAVAVYRWIPGCDYNVYFILRKIGRLAFPIYCFLLVEGFFHTRNVAKYRYFWIRSSCGGSSGICCCGC